MKKPVIVLSLGGSLIIPEDVDIKYLKEFKKTLVKHSKNNRFIVVCGGGSIARKYIKAIEKSKTGGSKAQNEIFQSFAGISATRMNARFMSYFFGFNQNLGIPHTLKSLKKYMRKQDIVFCGALEYKENQTSDSTAAQIAKNLKAKFFINLTNVQGLYDKNPKEYKNAEFIPWISWEDFDIMAHKITFKPGQHFVLDQHAATIINQGRIPTYILGKNIKNLNAVLLGKKFRGTLVNG